MANGEPQAQNGAAKHHASEPQTDDQVPSVLIELPLETFHRICALYEILGIIANPSEPSLCAKFEALRIDIELGNEVHRFHLLLLALQPISRLATSVSQIRDEYRMVAGEHCYEVYTNSDTYKQLQNTKSDQAEYENLLRDDAIHTLPGSGRASRRGEASLRW